MNDENQVVVSGRVRLARNYHDLPFSTLDQPQNAEQCTLRAVKAMDQHSDVYTLYQLSAMPSEAKKSLMEKHLISQDLLDHSDVGTALIREDQRVSIMMNEEDHLRIQTICAGLSLNDAMNLAFAVEDCLQSVCPFSFDQHLGYLTSCPTNTGTGMRASLMLHLPMLTRCKQIGTIDQMVAKLGLTMRGIYGEGSQALGDLYQISNQVTLGRSEQEIVDAVTAVGRQLIDIELTLRKRTFKQNHHDISDMIMRSYALLRYAIKMNKSELMKHWSNLRLGISLGLIKMPLTTADELLTIAQDAHVMAHRKAMQIDAPRDVVRCQIIQQHLINHPQEG